MNLPQTPPNLAPLDAAVPVAPGRTNAEFAKLYAELELQAADLRQANQDLTDSELRLRLALETGRIGLWVWNSTDVANAGDWSPRLKEIFGLPQDAVVTHEMFLACVHPDDRERVHQSIMAALGGQDGGRYRAEYRGIHPQNGTECWVTARGQAFFDAAGTAVRFIGTVMDITERKRAEEASARVTQELEERVRERTASLLRTQRLSQTGSFNWNAGSGGFVWSEETYRIFGFEPGSVVTIERLATRIPPDDLPRFRRIFTSSGENFHFDHHLVMPDGVRKYVQVAATAIRDEVGQLKEWVGAVRDITDLRRSEDHLRQVIDTIPGLVWSSLPNGDIEYLNKRWLDYTGLSLELAKGWGWQAAVHPDDLGGLLQYWASLLSEGSSGEYEARLKRFDGQYRWFLFRGVPLRDTAGHVIKWYGTNTDVEDMRASERLARGQVEALTHTLTMLSQESEPEKFLEHVLRMIGRQLGAHSLGVWEVNETNGRTELIANCEDDRVHIITPQEAGAADSGAMLRDHPVWKEFFRSGEQCVLGNIDGDLVRVRLARGPDTAWYNQSGEIVGGAGLPAMIQRLASKGIVATLCVPMVVAGTVVGFISIRFLERREFGTEELELARTLAHQATLAIQLMRLSSQSREAAVVAERNRMARDIHDTLAQGFTGVIVQLEAAADASSKGLAEEADQHLLRAGNLARESLREARQSVRALRPPVLEKKSLCAALSDLLREMTAGSAMLAKFEVKGSAPSVPARLEDNLLRIGQEVLTNALRHARATEFHAQLVFEPEGLRVFFQDNGEGFEIAARHEGFGLVGIRERVENMGGDLRMESARGRGTTVSITLPFGKSASLGGS